MNSTDIEIRIPATIADLPLAISEKIVLTHISSFPGCSNARLAELIGGTCRGVENLLHRLRRQGYIEQTGSGRARRHHLLFHVERHIKCGNTEITSIGAKSHRECGDQQCEPAVEPSSAVSVLKKELSLAEDYEQTLNAIQEMMYQPGIFPETILYLYRGILKRVENEAPDIPTKEGVVRELTMRRDAFVAICYAMRMPKRCQQRQALRLINNATSEKLARFREQVESGESGHNTALLLNDLEVARPSPLSQRAGARPQRSE